MAQRRKQGVAKSAKKTKILTLPYVPAPGYRVAVSDGANINTLKDGLGVTLQITFLRKDATPESESFEADISGGVIRQRGPSKFEYTPKKIKEFGVLLRPDHAFEIATTLFRVLGTMSDDERARYAIPQFTIETVDEGEQT